MNLKSYQFIEKLKKLPFIDEIWLYGSRAKCINREKSDIDLAIICPKATNKEWIIIQDIIEDSDTLLHVDYVRFDTIDQYSFFAQNILSTKIVLFKKNN